MKTALTLAAALLAGTAAIAQNTDSSSTMTPSTGAPATAPADSTVSPAADPAAGATTGASAGTVTEENGKWTVDGRPATKAEIAAHKKAMKKPN